MKTLSLDFETSSSTDLKKVGASKYSRSADLVVTVVAWAIDDAPVQSVTLPGRDGLPQEIKDHFKKGGLLAAWNASFECAILENYFNIFPAADKIICTMQRALYSGLPAALGTAGPALGLDVVKDKSAERLMREMSKPNRKGLFQFEDIEKLEALAAYCRQDVEAERAIANKIDKLPPNEGRVSRLDRKANNHGVRIDKTLINKMIALAAAETKALNQRATEITNGAVTSPGTQTAKVLQFFREGKAPPSLAKQNVLEALKSDDLTPIERELLELRQLAAKSSVKKLQAALNAAEDDDCIRGMLSYYGASRTGRWSGKGAGGFQPQNLPRPSIKDPDAAINDILAGNDISHHGPVLDVISSCLRGVIIPRPHKKFATVDLAQIEARVLPFLAGQDDILKVFESGKDVYTHTANKLGSDNRTLGKVLVLACGYGMGASKFKDTAKTYGLNLTDEEAENAVKAWRDASNKITAFWRKAGKTVKDAINNPNHRKFISKGLSAFAIQKDDGLLLRIKLPSGRELFYRNAQITEDDEITYAGSNQKTRKWESIRTYGGKLVENIVQAVARDVIASIALKIEDQNIGELILTIHDEVIIEVDEDKAAEKYHQINHIMHTAPLWAAGLPLGADGHIQIRYGKGGDAPPKIIDADDVEAEIDDDIEDELEDEIEIEIDEPVMQTQDEEKTIVVDFKNDGAASSKALDLALRYADAGLSVFPCRSDKKPCTENGFHDATTDATKLKDLFKHHARTAAVVGIACGKSGLVVIDADRPKPEKNNTDDGLALFTEKYGDIIPANTPRIRTPHKGVHFWFKALTDGRVITNAPGNLPPNVDVRGSGGYVIAPGSSHVGGAYVPECGLDALLKAYKSGTIPAIPSELVEVIGARFRLPGSTSYAEPMTEQMLREALEVIPNDSTFDNREDWVRMGHAIKGASGGAEWGKELWVSWSNQQPQITNDPAHVWDSLGAVRPITSGAGFIRQQLDKRGEVQLLQRAQLDHAVLVFQDSEGREPTEDELRAVVEEAQPIIQLTDSPYFKARLWAGDKNRRTVKCIVKNLITADGLTFIAGQPNAGKSAVAVNLSLCIAKGQKFAGRKTGEPKGVIYVAAEAPFSIMDRIDATKDSLFITDERLPICIMPFVPDLANQKERKQFIADMRGIVEEMVEQFNVPVGAVVIDTMARAFAMDDENSAAEMGRLIRAVDEMADGIGGCARIVIHHMGKDTNKGMRGSTALLGAADDELDVVVASDDEPDTITIKHKKSRNFARAKDVEFKLSTIKLGVDEDGDPLTTVAAEFVGDVGLKLDEVELKVLENLASTPRRSVEFEQNSKNITKQLERLSKTLGFIHKPEGKGQWRITDKGAAELAKRG